MNVETGKTVVGLKGMESSIVVATVYGELGRDRTLFHCSGYNVWRVR
jgi:hypothetical protein